ncbi:MAG: acyl--CoA ligase [Spirochaetales bacterium]|nr:acyl--CoA ligase [Spirochaetales bacterium]
MDRIYLVNHFLENSAQQYPDQMAAWFQDQFMNYSEMNHQANKLANHLIHLGIKRGDRIALLFDNSFHYIISYFAILKAGCVVVALNTDIQSESIIYQLNNSECIAMVAQKKYLRYLPEILVKTPHLIHLIVDSNTPGPLSEIGHIQNHNLEDILKTGSIEAPQVRNIDIDLAAIVYTSGSTGTPKGVMLSHLNLVSNMYSIVDYLSLKQSDSIMVVLPFFYIYGMSLLLTHFLVGAKVLIDNRFMYPNKVLESMKELGATGFAGVPSTFTILLNRSSLAEMDFPKLRYVTQAGGAMAVSTQKRVAEAFAPAELFIMYGSTEAAPRLSWMDPKRLTDKWGSIGKAVPNVDLFIGDEEGNPLPQGTEGELLARGSNMFQGYWHDLDTTEEVYSKGLYRSGDLGYMDDEGFLFITGRKKDIIKVKGYRVSAKEIEEYCLEIKEVHEAAAIGVDDPLLGEAIKLYIVPRENTQLDLDAITLFLNQKLPAYKRPKEIEVISNLPKNKAGKIMKTILKERNKK